MLELLKIEWEMSWTRRIEPLKLAVLPNFIILKNRCNLCLNIKGQFVSLFLFYFMYLRETVRDLLSASSRHKVQQPQLNPAKTRNLKLPPGLPRRWQGPKQSSHSLDVLAGSWIRMRVNRTQSSTRVWSAAIPRMDITHCSTMLLLQESVL